MRLSNDKSRRMEWLTSVYVRQADDRSEGFKGSEVRRMWRWISAKARCVLCASVARLRILAAHSTMGTLPSFVDIVEKVASWEEYCVMGCTGYTMTSLICIVLIWHSLEAGSP